MCNNKSILCGKKVLYNKSEYPLGVGFADFVFIPRYGINKPAILFELKWNKYADTAIKQIEKKNKYSEHLSDHIDNIYNCWY